MSSFTIREAKLQDADAIADIMVAAWRSAYTELIDPEYLRAMDRSRQARVYREAVWKMWDRYLVGESGSGVHGFVSGNILTEGPYDCEVKELYVYPAAQGAGIGAGLLRAMMAFFREAGLTRLLIWALRGAANNGFYRKMGGSEQERGESRVGERNCPLVGFVFRLE